MKNFSTKITRNDIAPNSLSSYGSYKSDDGESIRTQLAETKDGQWAVRAYTQDSGTEIFRGPFATQAEAEAAADDLDWQGFAE
jgi:hypothetical protein